MDNTDCISQLPIHSLGNEAIYPEGGGVASISGSQLEVALEAISNWKAHRSNTIYGVYYRKLKNLGKRQH